MTIQKTGKTPLEASKPKTYEFSDPEIEARWKESHGLKSPPLKDKAIELIQEGWRKLTRKFPALESGATHAKFKFALTKLEKQRDVQADKYLRVIQGLKNQLSKPDYSLFERKILLDDLTQEAKCSPHTRG